MCGNVNIKFNIMVTAESDNGKDNINLEVPGIPV